MIIDLVYAFIIGIVEGITEWLPISSTAHLILIEKIFDISNYPNTIFTSSFLLLVDVVIQLGAVMAVVVVYFKKLYPFAYNGSLSNKKDKLVILKNVTISLVPLLFIGLLLDGIVVELFYNLFTISIMLMVYGILFIVFNAYNKRQNKICDVTQISRKKALLVGFVQCLAVIPGTSRSGVTILFGGLLGMDKKTSMEYSFFLAIPVMLGASSLKTVKYLTNYTLVTKEIIILLITMMVSWLVSIFMVKKILKFIEKIDFKIFGYYRIVLGIIILFTIFW